MAAQSQDPREFIASFGNIDKNFIDPSLGSGNVANLNTGGILKNMLNIITQQAQQQQGPQLGPDEFGSYTIPVSDPTYTSGFDYARSIAGGIPMSQVIAPGVSYSPEQPGGYTQAQLNTAVGTTPTSPIYSPPGPGPDDPRYFGTGIGGVRIPVDRDKKIPPFRDIFGGMVDTRGQRERGEVTQRYVPGGGGIDYGGTGFFDDLLSLGIKIPPTAKIPPITQIPPRPIEVPPQRRPIPPISIGGVGGGAPINIGQPVPSPIDDRLPSPDFGTPSESLPIQGIEPISEIQPISSSISPIDIPPLENLINMGKLFGGGADQEVIDRIIQRQIEDVTGGINTPDVSSLQLPSYKQDILMFTPQVPTGDRFSIQQPTGSRFSISQPAPRGLF